MLDMLTWIALLLGIIISILCFTNSYLSRIANAVESDRAARAALEGSTDGAQRGSRA